LQDELHAAGHLEFQVLAVAIDNNVEAIRGFAENITFPVLIDADHLLTELYAISNVPTVLLIDEDDRIAMPNWSAYGTDTFSEFTGVSADRQHDRIRRWVREGDAGISSEDARAAVGDLTPEEEAARLHFRLAVALQQRGDADGADRHFDQAAALAPQDWTIRRAMMPLRGEDPFGQGFLDIYQDWRANGSPYHGLMGY
jgi:hypothetical protein